MRMRKDDRMDYFERIQNAIEYIEDNLQEKMSITNISSQSYFSADNWIFCTAIYSQ